MPVTRYPEFHYRWEWTLRSSPDALWPFVADTNRFNRETGVPPVEERTSTNRTNQSLANARRRLRLVRFGVPIEWEEEPFEWVRPYRFGVTRRYMTGPLAEMRILGELIPQASGDIRDDTRGSTRLEYQVWARPRNVLGLLAIPVQIGVLSAHQFGAAFHRYDERAAQHAPHEPPLDLTSDSQLAPGGRARLDDFCRKLVAQGVAPELAARLSETIERADDITLSHMRPYTLADYWGVPRREALELFLLATRVGLLDFQWDLLCPLCRGAKATSSSLRTMESQAHCPVCNIDFSAKFDRSVELTFRPNPAVRRIELRPYCVGGPQVTPHIVAQQLLPPHTSRTLAPPLEAGRYRLRTLGLSGGEFLRVTPDGATELALRADDDGWPEGETDLAPAPRLSFENATDGEQLFILERMAWSDQAVTAAEVTTLQAFRDLFSSEALRPGEQISVGSLTVVFTDLRDSTRLYRLIGDAPAFGRVMDHFDVLREAVRSEDGAIVKTIGDAVMAVFRRPIAGLRAMSSAQQALGLGARASRQHPLVLKVGLHHGPCIAVNLNERLDYFGSTVNIAARIQNLSVGDDVVISEAVRHDPEVAEWLAHHSEQVMSESFSTTLKGIEGSFELWRVTRMQNR